MTLSFSTKWPDRMGDLAGQPNYFIQKIWMGFPRIDLTDISLYEKYYEDKPWDIANTLIEPKLHTIREDKHNRWRPGMDIHPVINNRTKDRFQFASTIKCVSVQEIEIEYLGEIRKHYSWTDVWSGGNRRICVYIDGNMADSDTITNLAINDGFPSVEALFSYFNTDFTGKLIHWTDLRY